MADETPVKAVQVKLVLLGEAAVGKSSLVLRFVSNDFNDNTSPTIGAAFLTQKCRLENRVVKFEIWDTAGQERFHSLAPMYYRNAAAAVVVYDITKSASLEKAKAWVKELQRQANPNIVIALIGNKVDLVEGTSLNEVESSTTPKDPAEVNGEENGDDDDDDATPPPPSARPEVPSNEDRNVRQVQYEEAASYAKECGLLFFEASAKTGANVGEVFTEIAKTIPLDTATPKPAAGGTKNASAAGHGQEGVNLGDNGQAKKAGCC